MATLRAPATHKPRIRRGYNPGVYYVESRTRAGKVHMMNTRYLHCSCEAGKRRMRCWHITYCVALDDWRRRQQGTARKMTVAGVGGQDRRRPLGTEAREMLTHAPALSVASPDAIADCMVVVTFTPCTPIGATAVAFSPDLGADHVGLLDLLDDCIARLVCYRTDYAAAMADDQGDPLS